MKHLLTTLLLATILLLGYEQAAGQFVWTKDVHNPVVTGGAAGTWNYHVDQPCVLFNSDSARYELWFVGFRNTRPGQIGFATSKDGVNWTMYPSPILSPDSGKWDSYSVEMPRVIREGGGYKMWYAGCPNATFAPCYIGYATSTDGVHWTKYIGNPIMAPGPSAWEAGGVYIPFIMPVATGYRMWYCGYDISVSKGQVGYAFSKDGLAWTRDTVNNPVIRNGDSGQWDDAWVDIPNVLKVGTTYYLWYMGQRAGSSNVSVGVATSQDSGMSWIKYAANPVLAPTLGAWDANATQVGSVLHRGDTLEMWYSGGTRWKIGHALSVVVVGAIEGERTVAQHIALHQNYPNPFNPSTTIKYELPNSAAVRLSVHDMLGREVFVLVNERKDAGVYAVRFDGGNLSSGMYVYRLRAGDYVITKRMILMK
jgi:predicted GH43/DUF377 family glycosyl hydrolase